MLILDPSRLEFGGRHEVIRDMLDYFCETLLYPFEHTPLYFINASPGVGKTRLFLQMVKLEVEELKRHLSNNHQINAKREVVDDFLHVAVSFNGSTSYNPLHIKLGNIPNVLSHITLRMMHIWLTNTSINELFADIVAAVASGELASRHLRLESVLPLIARRAGRKHIILFVDEIRNISDSEVRNSLVAHLAGEQDVVHDSHSLRICFSTQRVDFSAIRSLCGRKICCTPLPLLSSDDTQRIVAQVLTRQRDKFLRNKSSLFTTQLIGVMTLLSGGHMCALEHLSSTLEGLDIADSFAHYIDKACRSYDMTYTKFIFGAVLLSLVGYYTYIDVRVKNSGTSITVEDMVAIGQLIAPLTEETFIIQPNMPLILLMKCALLINERKKKNGGHEFEIANIITKLVDLSISSCRKTGKKFSTVCIIRHMLMRQLHSSLMEGNIVRNITGIDWRSATLKDYFQRRHREGPMLKELENLRFEFTQPLPYVLLDDENIQEFFRRNYNEKLTRIGQPMNENLEASDYFISLVSKSHEVVTIAVQTKCSSAGLSTRVDISSIDC